MITKMKNVKPMITLKNLRKEKGLKQKELAEKVGINWQVLSSYEQGYRRPDLVTLYNLSVALECRMDDLVADLL